jgi:hypothetical protein
MVEALDALEEVKEGMLVWIGLKNGC